MSLDILDKNLANLTKFYGDNLHLIIGGDFNISYKTYGNRRDCQATEKKLLQSFEHKNSLYQMIDSPTRSTNSTMSLIDLIFVKDKNFISEAGVLSLM